MAINISVHYNGGYLPDMILLTLPGILLSYGNPEVLSFAAFFPTQTFGHFPSLCCLGDAQKVWMCYRLLLKLYRQGTYVPGRS